MEFEKYRKLFPVTKTNTYLNHAAVSPFSLKVIKSINEYLAMRSQNGVDAYPFVMQTRADLKKNISRLRRRL